VTLTKIQLQIENVFSSKWNKILLNCVIVFISGAAQTKGWPRIDEACHRYSASIALSLGNLSCSGVGHVADD
jgi:hypothetical protein